MSLVRTALYSNAVFSSCTGLLATVAPGVVATWLGTTAVGEVRVVGLQLLAFAVVVAFVGRRRRVKPLPVLLIRAADAAWVVGTGPLLLLLPEQFNATGHALMIGVATVVAACATGGRRGLSVGGGL